VELRGATRDDGGIEIEVADRGPGLPSPIENLLTSPRGPRGPRGRGLAIAAEIAERHGGRLAATADEEGSRISLSLPGTGADGA
jgi:signal transduction histidine kinase